MFAHQVIEDLKIFPCRFDEAKRFLLKIIEFIKNSHQFHIGDLDDIDAIRKADEGKRLFMDNNLRLPYRRIWIDCTCNKNLLSEPKKNETTNTKEAVLAQEISKTTWEVTFFSYIKELKSWCPLFASFTIDIGDIDKKGNITLYLIKNLEQPPLFKKCQTDQNAMNLLLKEYSLNFSLLSSFVKLINCKNIQTEKIKAPEALNKKRRKTGKQEIFDYHVLNVVVPSKRQEYHKSTESLFHNRLHLCRGHFKEYTKEHPLFGRLTGLYWWQPHVRGQNKDGIVMKDYVCDFNQAEINKCAENNENTLTGYDSS